RSSCKRTPRAKHGRASGAILTLMSVQPIETRACRASHAAAEGRATSAIALWSGGPCQLSGRSESRRPLFRFVRRVVAGRFEANGGVMHSRFRPVHGLLLLLRARDRARRGGRLLPGNGARCDRVLRNEAENLAILVVGDEPDCAFLVDLDVTDAATELGEHELVLHDFAVSDARADDAFGCEPAVQQVTLPLGEQLACVNGQSGGRNRLLPDVDRRLEPLDDSAASYARAGVIDAARLERPAVVAARLDEVDLIAAERSMLVGPQLAGLRMDGHTLDVTMPPGIDHLIFIGIVYERVVRWR